MHYYHKLQVDMKDYMWEKKVANPFLYPITQNLNLEQGVITAKLLHESRKDFFAYVHLMLYINQASHRSKMTHFLNPCDGVPYKILKAYYATDYYVEEECITYLELGSD